MDPFVEKIIEKRFFQKDESSWEDVVSRVATDISMADDEKGRGKWKDVFMDMLLSKTFLPNSPTLMNAGGKFPILQACFVLDVPDRMEDIMERVKVSAMIQKMGGGVGYNFSYLRPQGDPLRSTGGEASGPVSFIGIFDTLTEAVKQGGKRRGANLACLSSHHPDIFKFVRAKAVEGCYRNFNFSVWFDDAFFEALEKETMYKLINPNIYGQDGGMISPEELLDVIVWGAWKNGEPGVLFGDTINRDNPTPYLGKIEACNPCGEQPLLAWEACNLGSIDLTKFVKEDKTIDYKELERVIEIVVRFLDNVIDRSKFVHKRIETRVRENRKIGLGVMGFADMLLKMEIKYGSEESLNIAQKVMEFIDYTSKECSIKLAEEKGPFANWNQATFRWLEKYKDLEKPLRKFGIRNATTTSIAPTGTLSLIAGVSSGIEPNFGWKIVRKDTFGKREIVHPLVEKYGDGDNLPPYFVTASDIGYEEHIRMQAAFQKFVDSGISKTINFAEEATQEDIRNAILLAHELGCKGLTVYRKNSRQEQVLMDKPAGRRHRSLVVGGVTLKSHDKEFLWEGKKALITLNFDGENYPVECIINFGKAGKELFANSEGYGRLISLALQYGVPLREIIKQLRGIGSDKVSFSRGERYDSLPDFIGKALNTIAGYIVKASVRREMCAVCGGEMEYKEGCYICPGCGFSKCL